MLQRGGRCVALTAGLAGGTVLVLLTAVLGLGPEVLERELELSSIRSLIVGALGGEGGAIVISGAAGIGKTELLRAARALGSDLGVIRLEAQGAELERDFAFGVARQLFEPIVQTEEARAAVLSGAGGLAAPILVRPGSASARPPPDRRNETIHGLYWGTVKLSERTPVLIAVDDAHWADVPSLRWLAYLARRLEGLRVAMLIGLRQGEGTHRELDSFQTASTVTRLAPAALSQRAVASLMHRRLGVKATPAFAKRCHEFSGGIPLFARQLVEEVASTGVSPSAANAGRVQELAAEDVTSDILARIGALPTSSCAVARAVAILGPQGRLGEVAALARLPVAEAARAGGVLGQSQIFSAGPGLRFAQPIVRDAVYRSIPRPERAVAHACAARVLAAQGGSPERVAAQLLVSEPTADAWTVQSLRGAARQARTCRAPQSAALYLRRALEEPPRQDARIGVLMELGDAEHHTLDSRAIEHLDEALAAARDPRDRMQAAFLFGRALLTAGRGPAALEVLVDVGADAAAADRELALTIEAELLAATRATPSARPERERLDAWRRTLNGATPAERVLLAGLAEEAMDRARPASEVLPVAEQALAKGRLLAEQGPASPPFYGGCAALMCYDRLGQARGHLDSAVDEARRSGSAAGLALACAWRAMLGVFEGALADAEADARKALELGAVASNAVAVAALAAVLLERGQPRAAADQLRRAGFGEHIPPAVAYGQLLYYRGLTRAGLGNREAALRDVLDAGRAALCGEVIAPAVAPWRSTAAILQTSREQGSHGRAPLKEELTLARSLDAARPLGIALRAQALLESGQTQIDLLHQATEVLEGSESRLEFARALTDLGAALRRERRRREARKPLVEGLDLAHRCGATALEHRAHDELLAAGARPRRRRCHGSAALTPSEHRVAKLAAQGATNRDIAQQLFITLKTVEMHLTRTYQKLDIDRRSQLTASLNARQ
ncbi:MAG: AAA family ATPase [Solirubrobacteraceae bacterium]